MTRNRHNSDLDKSGSFFYTQNMDVNKLCDKVLNSEELKDVPLIYVFLVMESVLDAIGSGECFYQTEFD